MRSKALWVSTYILGLIFCVVPPAIAVIDRYGFFQTEQKVSAFVLALLLLCALPFLKQIRNAIKSFAENPSIEGVWLALTVFLWLFRVLADDILIVCYIALPSNVIGARLMAMAHKRLKEE